jgi:hypothetical protein
MEKKHEMFIDYNFRNVLRPCCITQEKLDGIILFYAWMSDITGTVSDINIIREINSPLIVCIWTIKKK